MSMRRIVSREPVVGKVRDPADEIRAAILRPEHRSWALGDLLTRDLESCRVWLNGKLRTNLLVEHLTCLA